MAFDSDVLELNIELEKISKYALGLEQKQKSYHKTFLLIMR